MIFVLYALAIQQKIADAFRLSSRVYSVKRVQYVYHHHVIAAKWTVSFRINPRTLMRIVRRDGGGQE